MGKALPSSTKLQEFARVASSVKLQTAKRSKPIARIRVATPETVKSEGVLRATSERAKSKKMEGLEEQRRLPLAHVVSDCVKRWFQDTLKEAKAGDSGMQVLVGQMYYNGYGVPRDAHKGQAWISRASKSRTSVWKVSNKRPGYNASDSDSDETKSETK